MDIKERIFITFKIEKLLFYNDRLLQRSLDGSYIIEGQICSSMFSFRPSKAMSCVLMVVATLMGIFGLIMLPKGFGFLKFIWAVMAFGMAVLHGANVFSKNGIFFGEIIRKSRRKLK